MSHHGQGLVRVLTDDMRHAFTRRPDGGIVIERIEVVDGLRFARPLLEVSERDWVDVVAALCLGSSTLSTANFALRRAEVARLHDGR